VVLRAHKLLLACQQQGFSLSVVMCIFRLRVGRGFGKPQGLPVAIIPPPSALLLEAPFGEL